MNFFEIATRNKINGLRIVLSVRGIKFMGHELLCHKTETKFMGHDFIVL